MKRYDSYKDSGEQWLGRVPSHWDIKRLGSYFLERKVKVSDKEYTPLSVTKNGILPQLDNVAKSNDNDNRKLVKAGDFVINSRSDRKGSSGVSMLDGSVSLINLVLQPRNGIIPSFCNYLLKSYPFVEEYYRNGRGIVADLWTTRYDEMKSIKLAMPPLEEQKRMVEYLDTQTTQIDEAIAQQQKMIDLLNERKQIIINNAVTKGLNPDVPMKDSGVEWSGVEWIGMIPEHWEVMKMKYVFFITDGTHFSPVTTSEGKKYVTVSNVHDDIIDIENANCISLSDFSVLVKQGCQPKIGDILLAKDGTVGRSAIVTDNDFVALSSLGILSPKGGDNISFLKRMLDAVCLQEQMREQMAGSALKRITISKISNLNAVIPPSSEQNIIVEYIQTSITPIDNSIYAAKQQIALLQERKQIIINEVVTGKIKV